MALSTDDIAQIARNPNVGAVWARMANLKYGQLRNGNPKIAARVRAAIVKDPAAFASSLAPGWNNLLEDGDRPDDQFDELALRAIAAGFLLGPKAGSALVYSVADSDLPHSEEVRRRLEELLEHATNPLPYGGEGWPAGLILRPVPTDGDEADQDDSEIESDLADESGLFIGEAAAVVARTSEDDMANLCGTPMLIGAYREEVTVYWTEVNSELAMFVTPEEQGRDLKDTLCTYGTGNLEESEKADLCEVPDAQVSNWLAKNDINPNNVSWGETVMQMPKGYKLIRGDWW